MNEEPKSIWRKPRSGVKAFCFWLTLFAGGLFLAIYAIATVWRVNEGKELAKLALAVTAIIIIGAIVALGIFRCIRWLCCWRNFRRFLIGVACFATLIALAYVEENVRGKWAWEKFKREWEAKGERFDLASVVPPPVPDEQNFALTPIVASSYATYFDKNGHEVRPRNTNVVNRLMMVCDRDLYGGPTNNFGNWQRSRPTDLKGWQEKYRALSAKTNEFPVLPQPQSPAADVLLALSKYDSTIEELRQASQLPGSRFPLTYDLENPAVILLPHLAALKGCSLVLELRAIAELQNEQGDKALADVKLMLRLEESIRGEPILISHLVRIAIVNLVLQPIWEGLSAHRWSDAQLVELDRQLTEPDFLAAYGLAMRGEMACQSGIIDYVRHHRAGIFDFYREGDSVPSFSARYLDHLVPSGWFCQNQLRCARFMVKFYLPAVDLNRGSIFPAFVGNADTAFDAELRHRNPYNFLEHLLLPALGSAARKFAAGQCYVDLARAACALERYRLAHGEYPASLDALTPQFIAKLPHDVIGGQPLKYRRTEDGQFMLYSVGWNETDDGGQIELTKGGSIDTAKGDWVWRYPAK